MFATFDTSYHYDNCQHFYGNWNINFNEIVYLWLLHSSIITTQPHVHFMHSKTSIIIFNINKNGGVEKPFNIMHSSNDVSTIFINCNSIVNKQSLTKSVSELCPYSTILIVHYFEASQVWSCIALMTPSCIVCFVIWTHLQLSHCYLCNHICFNCIYHCIFYSLLNLFGY